MAASQALLSLFSCPIHNISEKHIERGPQGTREGLTCYRRCDPLQDLIIDRYCRKGSEAAEHTVLLRADHVIMSRKLQETVQDLTMNITKNVSEWAQSYFTLDEAHHFKSTETLIHFYVYSHKVLTCKEAEWFQSTSEKNVFLYTQTSIIISGLYSMNNITFVITWLLREQHAGKHLLAWLRVLISLKGEERLRLVFWQP